MDDGRAPDGELLLRRAYAAGRAAHDVTRLSFDAYARGVHERVAGRLASLGLEPTPERRRSTLPRLCLEDLVLVLACDDGEEAAWAALRRLYAPRLGGLARKQGLETGAAQDLVDSMLADLALPAPRGGAGTVIGTYRGSGSLFGWLATTLVRRIAGEARRRRPESLAVQAAEGHAAAGIDPPTAAHASETASALGAAMRVGLASCTPRERLVIVLKHRDDLPHREIARVLGVGVPRVSQLLRQAQERLRLCAQRDLPGGIPEGLWPEVVAAAADALATIHPDVPPTATKEPKRETP